MRRVGLLFYLSSTLNYIIRSLTGEFSSFAHEVLGTIALAVLGSCVASASTRGAFAFFDPYIASAFYHDHGISVQAARFV